MSTLSAALLAGCGSNPPAAPPLARDIGPAPAYLQEAPVPLAQPGLSVLVHNRQLEQTVEAQNVVICAVREEWDRTRGALQAGGQGVPQSLAGAARCSAKLGDRAKRGKRR